MVIVLTLGSRSQRDGPLTAFNAYVCLLFISIKIDISI